MKNCTNAEVSSLLKLTEINVARVSGYESAISKTGESELKKHLVDEFREMSALTNQLNLVINDFPEKTNYEKINDNNEKISCTNFYFTVAKVSGNPRTVILSCYLGDKSALAAYRSFLKSETTNLSPCLREILSKQLTNVEESFLTTSQILFEMTFA